MMIASSSVVGMAQTQLESGIDLTNMDLTANPATDFYQYALVDGKKRIHCLLLILVMVASISFKKITISASMAS